MDLSDIDDIQSDSEDHDSEVQGVTTATKTKKSHQKVFDEPGSTPNSNEIQTVEMEEDSMPSKAIRDKFISESRLESFYHKFQ